MKLLFLARAPAEGSGQPARPIPSLVDRRPLRAPAKLKTFSIPLLSSPLPQLNSPIFKSKVAHFNARTLASLLSPSLAAAQVCRLLCALFAAAAVLGRTDARTAALLRRRHRAPHRRAAGRPDSAIRSVPRRAAAASHFLPARSLTQCGSEASAAAAAAAAAATARRRKIAI